MGGLEVERPPVGRSDRAAGRHLAGYRRPRAQEPGRHPVRRSRRRRAGRRHPVGQRRPQGARGHADRLPGSRGGRAHRRRGVADRVRAVPGHPRRRAGRLRRAPDRPDRRLPRAGRRDLRGSDRDQLPVPGRATRSGGPPPRGPRPRRTHRPGAGPAGRRALVPRAGRRDVRAGRGDGVEPGAADGGRRGRDRRSERERLAGRRLVVAERDVEHGHRRADHGRDPGRHQQRAGHGRDLRLPVVACAVGRGPPGQRRVAARGADLDAGAGREDDRARAGRDRAQGPLRRPRRLLGPGGASLRRVPRRHRDHLGRDRGGDELGADSLPQRRLAQPRAAREGADRAGARRDRPAALADRERLGDPDGRRAARPAAPAPGRAGGDPDPPRGHHATARDALDLRVRRPRPGQPPGRSRPPRHGRRRRHPRDPLRRRRHHLGPRPGLRGEGARERRLPGEPRAAPVRRRGAGSSAVRGGKGMAAREPGLAGGGVAVRHPVDHDVRRARQPDLAHRRGG